MTTDDVTIVGDEAEDGFTESIPLRRFGQPEEVAVPALPLASDTSSSGNGGSTVLEGRMTNTG